MVYSLMVPSLLEVGFHILLLFLLFSFYVDQAMSTNDYIDSRCNFTANYTAGGAFEANMRSVFSTLTKDAPPVLFANATAGQGSGRVYGLAQCRGDVDQDTCNTCISNYTVQVVDTYCPNAMDAIIWYEKCQLRYSNTNFFGLLNVEDSGNWYWIANKLQNFTLFSKKLGRVLKNLTYQATTEKSKLMFATGSIPYKDQQSIYGLVQCTRDTSLTDCSQCLNSTISQIPTTCEDGGLAHGCEIVTGSCRVRFDTELFYRPTATPSPSSSPNSAPPPLSKSSPSRSPNPAPPSNSSPRPSPNPAPPSSSSPGPSSNPTPPSNPSPSPPPNSAPPSNLSPSPSPNSAPPSNSRPSPSSSTGSSNTDKVNHSNVVSVTLIAVFTFALTSTYLF